MDREALYIKAMDRITALIEGVHDEIAIMATVAAELHHSMPWFHWTGFYRVTRPGVLSVGPYQGGHGCLVIPFDRGVCGAAATTCQTQLVEDVNAAPHHIACSSTTQSEIVVPIMDSERVLRAVLDVDSDEPAAFNEIDQRWLERVCATISAAIWPTYEGGGR